jgi:AcrR family transcriptional regulator
VNEPVKAKPQRTRRADRAQATATRIVEAARRLFLERGYAPTTIEAVADAADVAVETVYARFRNKRTLLLTVVEHAVTEHGAIPLQQRPELAKLAAETDQRRRLRQAAALSSNMLQRISPVYALLKDATQVDDSLRDHLREQISLRRDFQHRLVDLIERQAPLRVGLTSSDAAETYSALANPETYLLLTEHHGWTPDRYQTWLADTLERLLLSERPTR